MEEREKVIDGTTYVVKQMDAERALRVQAKLIKVLGPGIAELKGSTLTKEKIKGKMATAILSLVERFDDEVVVDLVISLFETNVFYKHTTDELLKVSFSMHFTGKISEMWKVAIFVLEVNFGDLLGKFKSSSLIKEAMEEELKKES